MSSSWTISFLVTIIIATFTCYSCASDADTKVYIVYMGGHPNDVSSVDSVLSLHMNVLNQVIKSDASSRLVHSFKRINGFVAHLSAEEVMKIAGMDEVVSVIPNKLRKLHTTKSWNFLGFPKTVDRVTLESDVIVGMLDTGVWPESESFNDAGYGPPPSKWKGICQTPSNFTCNNKIIGARYYHLEGKIQKGDIESPRDTEGHGSHTASTVAGNFVENASLSGLARGTARGGVPSARIAIYKVCWTEGCYDADTLAAFDDAIADGVDVISFSIGGEAVQDYFENAVDIGSFHAMKNGILTSCSAGNDGPQPSMENYAPWMMTVAASTIDRKFVSQVKLGNGQRYEGMAINTAGLDDKEYPLVYAGNVPNVAQGFNSSVSRFCFNGTMDRSLVKGKIVLCDSINDGTGLFQDGAAGGIMQADLDVAFSFPLTLSVLGRVDGANVSQYVYDASINATANVLRSEVVDDPEAPYVVYFSSRGPNPITKDILKPDLSAPGADILAAWSPMSSSKPGLYNIISGTSMACPHATGSAAYVKSFHPTWSPAAIKSALMTTAIPMSPSKNTDAELAYGAGQINPAQAVNPGLVYDAHEADYIKILCGQGYSDKNLSLVTGDKSTCSSANNDTALNLNYPSFALSAQKEKPFSASFRRTVTNVGDENSIYKATIKSPSEVKIQVKPDTFSFKSLLEKQSFVVEIEGVTSKDVVSASLELFDGVHRVRSPVVVYTVSDTRPLK